MKIMQNSVEALKGVSEVLTKHKRKFIATLTAMGLIFVLALNGTIPGATASSDIKIIVIGFVTLEVLSKTKILNGKN